MEKVYLLLLQLKGIMSKRDLKKYLNELDKDQLHEQVMTLYEKFPAVKTYFDFVFNPKEDDLIKDAKIKIRNEYFPTKGKRPKMRRSTGQKFIKHFISLGVDSFKIADVMLFNVETAQSFSAKKQIKYESFFKSMLVAYDQAIRFIVANGMVYEFRTRIEAINEEANHQNWFNKFEFNAQAERLDY